MRLTTTEFDPILFDVPMPIVTPRFIIRPPCAGDGAMVSEAKRESWAELQRWMPWAKSDGPDAVKDEAMCRQKAADFDLRVDMQIHAHDPVTGEFIGGTGFHRYCWKARRFEIGYFVRTGKAGQGYGREIATAMAHYAFAVLGANRVEIKMDTRNGASEAVAKAAGFVRESTAHRESIGADGTLRDMHTYVAFNRDVLPDMKVDWGRP